MTKENYSIEDAANFIQREQEKISEKITRVKVREDIRLLLEFIPVMLQKDNAWDEAFSSEAYRAAAAALQRLLFWWKYGK